jgi:hypothetical protein
LSAGWGAIYCFLKNSQFASSYQQARVKEENRILDVPHAMLGVLLKKSIPDSTQIDLIWHGNQTGHSFGTP